MTEGGWLGFACRWGELSRLRVNISNPSPHHRLQGCACQAALTKTVAGEREA